MSSLNWHPHPLRQLENDTHGEQRRAAKSVKKYNITTDTTLTTGPQNGRARVEEAPKAITETRENFILD